MHHPRLPTVILHLQYPGELRSWGSHSTGKEMTPQTVRVPEERHAEQESAVTIDSRAPAAVKSPIQPLSCLWLAPSNKDGLRSQKGT